MARCTHISCRTADALWAADVAPVVVFWRRVSAPLPVKGSSIAGVAAGGAILALIGALALIGFLLLRDGTDQEDTTPAALVYLRGDDLWVASLDGVTLPPREVASSEFGVAYAGYVPEADGQVDLFYTSGLTEPRTAEVFVQEFGFYRAALKGNSPEEVFRFTGPAFVASAAIAPDGAHAVYTDADGLVLRELASGEEELLAPNERVIAGDGSVLLTDIIVSPRWSPAGEAIHALKYIGPDSTVNVVLASPPEIAEAGYENHRAAWSRDGERLCLWGSEIQSETGLFIYEPAAATTMDVLATIVLPTPAPLSRPGTSGCAWASDGRLAFGYNQESTGTRIAILDGDLNVLEISDPVPRDSRVVAWLDDGSGVVYNAGGASSPGIYRPDSGELDALPFDADWVVGVIP